MESQELIAKSKGADLSLLQNRGPVSGSQQSATVPPKVMGLELNVKGLEPDVQRLKPNVKGLNAHVK